ncbi:MAG: phosphoribosylaminoimidazolesuccinocarboxamide synthase [Acidimicrobiales bacterium]
MTTDVVSMPDPNVLIALDATHRAGRHVVVAGVPSHRLDLRRPCASLPGGRSAIGYTLGPTVGADTAPVEPIVTPPTKATPTASTTADRGEVAEQGLVEPALWKRIQQVALDLFARGAAIADAAGFVLADTANTSSASVPTVSSS